MTPFFIPPWRIVAVDRALQVDIAGLGGSAIGGSGNCIGGPKGATNPGGGSIGIASCSCMDALRMIGGSKSNANGCIEVLF